MGECAEGRDIDGDETSGYSATPKIPPPPKSTAPENKPLEALNPSGEWIASPCTGIEHR